MTDVIRLLEADHEELRALLKKLDGATGREARNLLGRVRRALEVHTQAEEEIVYPAFKRIVGGDRAAVLVQESLTEHDLVEGLMDEMDSLRAGSTAFRGKAMVLRELVDHHASDEEEDMFPKLRQHAGAKRLAELGERFAQRKDELNVERASMSELHERARDAGIDGRSKMGRGELIQALQE